jgi:hypothetical protein
MEQSSWKADSQSAGQGILRLLWNQEFIVMFTRAGPYPETDESSSHTHILFLQDTLY